MIDISKEKEFLESLVDDYITSDNSSQLRLMRNLMMDTYKPFIIKGNSLELGCEIGYMSEIIASLSDKLDIVDGSQKFLNEVEKRNISNATLHCQLFEEFEPKINYDNVFASHILEHLLDVPSVLKMVRKSLKSTGLFFVAVPNARALSRQLARHMGLIESLYDLTPNDIRGGHRRVYDRVTLTREIESCGFEIISQGGILFKPFADFQMDKLIDSGLIGQTQIEGLMKLGNEYPDMCANIFMICRVKSK